MGGSQASRFLDLLRVLTRHEIDFVVVGAVAGVLAGVPLVTFDLDVVFDKEESNIQRLLAALEEIGAHYRDVAGRHIVPDVSKLSTFRVNLFETDLGHFDALPSIGEGLGYAELLTRSVVYELDELRVRSIDLPTLIEAKEYAGRPKDLHALLFIREVLAQQSGQAELQGSVI